MAPVGVKWPEKHDYVTRKHDYVTKKTRTAVGKEHDCVTEKHGPRGLKSPAVEPAKHGGAGRLSVEAPVRPMRVAARVEIPSRKAGETRLSGASKRGGAPLKADVRCCPGCLFFAYGRPKCAAISG